MMLTEKQKDLIKDLQTQEKLCIEKYGHYQNLAKDSELKNLFGSLKKEEERHLQSLTQLLNGTCPSVDTKDNSGMLYNPTATYTGSFKQEDKDFDKFLCTDCIATEKYVSSTYNDQLFQFADANVRRLFNDIQTEEQNHAEKIYKYKSVNKMTESA